MQIHNICKNKERKRSRHRRCESYLFFLLFPSNLFTFLSSTYFSDLKFCVFLSLVLLSLSSSVFLSSQANYNRCEGKTLFHSFILYSLSLFLFLSHSFFPKEHIRPTWNCSSQRNFLRRKPENPCPIQKTVRFDRGSRGSQQKYYFWFFVIKEPF